MASSTPAGVECIRENEVHLCSSFILSALQCSLSFTHSNTLMAEAPVQGANQLNRSNLGAQHLAQEHWQGLEPIIFQLMQIFYAGQTFSGFSFSNVRRTCINVYSCIVERLLCVLAFDFRNSWKILMNPGTLWKSICSLTR